MDEEGEIEAGTAQMTHAHIGETLKAARLEQGRELADIAGQTRVPLRHLQAIEDGVHDDLPAMPYTLGFVKNYARAVGIDPDAAAAQFRQETTMVPREPTVTVLEPIDERRAPPRAAFALGLFLIALVVAFSLAWGAGWFGGENDVAEVVDDPLTPTEEVATALAPPEPEPVAAPETAGLTAAPQGQVVLTANTDVWVRIGPAGGGASVFQEVMAAGDTYEVPPGRDDLVLRTGRAGALDITVGGQAVEKLGELDDFVENVPLTASGLAARGG